MAEDIKKTIRHLAQKSKSPNLIEDAFEFAKLAYKERVRLSGENYIYHAVRVASMLDEMGLDATTIAFGILHDVLDEAPLYAQKIEVREIEKKFGKEIGGMVEKISELGKIRYSFSVVIKEKKIFSKEKIENLRKMFLAIAGDIRVIIVELISRQDGLNLLNYLPEDQQKLYSLETLQIFVPVANRLGLSEIRRGLEDASFSYLFPKKFDWVKKNVKKEYEEREKYLRKFIPHLKKIFKKEKAKIIQIDYRAKSYWSTYKKLAKHNMDIDRVHDLLALRIITNDIESCYRVLGIIHKRFHPISEEINDYIAKPKPNGYRSLHTTILLGEDEIVEVQIKTEDMHREAEYGVCAHWSYKEAINLKKEGEKFEWVKRVPEFKENFKIDFFENQVFVFTPKGDIITLPKNSTPIDFAYAVHSQIGDHCESAKINGKIVQLNNTLKNGDVVEVTTNKKRLPSKDWLRFVKTSMAKSHIKKATEKDKTDFNFPIPGFIKRKIIEFSEATKKKSKEKEIIKKEGPRQIYLAGQKGMLINIAKCCSPQPGDKVKAYLTKHRSAVLHKISCPNFKRLAEKFPDKIIDASW